MATTGVSLQKALPNGKKRRLAHPCDRLEPEASDRGVLPRYTFAGLCLRLPLVALGCQPTRGQSCACWGMRSLMFVTLVSNLDDNERTSTSNHFLSCGFIDPEQVVAFDGYGWWRSQPDADGFGNGINQ